MAPKLQYFNAGGGAATDDEIESCFDLDDGEEDRSDCSVWLPNGTRSGQTTPSRTDSWQPGLAEGQPARVAGGVDPRTEFRFPPGQRRRRRPAEPAPRPAAAGARPAAQTEAQREAALRVACAIAGAALGAPPESLGSCCVCGRPATVLNAVVRRSGTKHFRCVGRPHKWVQAK